MLDYSETSRHYTAIRWNAKFQIVNYYEDGDEMILVYDYQVLAWQKPNITLNKYLCLINIIVMAIETIKIKLTDRLWLVMAFPPIHNYINNYRLNVLLNQLVIDS